MDTDTQYGEMIRERFAQLPKVVQDAITSADVSQRMQELAKKHSLHVDQWEALENEVQLTLLGVVSSEDLVANLERELRINTAAATLLAEDISTTVFEPIRQELERQLEHPNAQAQTTTGVEDVRTQVLAGSSAPVAAPAPAPNLPIEPLAVPLTPAEPAPAAAVAPVQPATPPPIAPTQKVERAPLSTAYKPAEPSHERKAVEGDPYREQIS